MSNADPPIHLKPLSVYSQMVCAEQQSKANSSFYNIKVHISNHESKSKAHKRRLDDSCFDEICETPLKRPCIITTCSPDQGCYSFDFHGSTPLQTLIITKNVTPPRSKVSQPVTPVVASTPLSNYATNLHRESLPSPIPLLKWDREGASPEILLYPSLNLDRPIPSVASEGTVKVKVEEVLHDIIPNHESIAKPPTESAVPLKEEEVLLSVSQQAGPEVSVGYGESTADSFESTLPLQVQVKSKVVVPDNTKAFCEPVVCEEEWRRNKRTYVESVRRHMTEQNGVISELDSLMNSIANQKTGRNDPHWQHPSDLTQRNYKNSHAKHPLISLEEWQKQNHLTFRRFANVPDIFQRSPVL